MQADGALALGTMGAVTQSGRSASPADEPAARAWDGPPGPGTSVWRRTVVGWHIAFWAVLSVATVAGSTADLSPRGRITYIAMLGVLGIAYAVAGHPAAATRNPARSRSYLVVLVVVLGLVAAMFPDALLVLYIAYPQVWFFSSSPPEGALWSGALTAAVTAGVTAAGGWSLAALGDAAPQLLISLGVSLALGLWISRVVDQSEERAVLIAALQTTRTELATAHHAAGVAAERERVAREIHDTIAQGFTSIVMLAETATAQLARDRPDLVPQQLELIEDTARDNLAEARSLVAAFSPAALHHGTLPDALRRLAQRFEAETAVVTTVRCDPDDAAVAGLHAGQQVVLLRVAPEALANVRKHARAEHVAIVVTGSLPGSTRRCVPVASGASPDVDRASLRCASSSGAVSNGGTYDADGASPSGASIEISDDGCGFDPGAAPRGGFGLAGMRSRVEEVGGRVLVESRPDAGTRVRIVLPVHAVDLDTALHPSAASR